MLEYEIKNEDGKITIVVERDQYDYEHEFDNDPDVYELEEKLVKMAEAALEKPVRLNPVGDEVFVIHRWGTLDELELLAAGGFEIVLDAKGQTTDEAVEEAIAKLEYQIVGHNAPLDYEPDCPVCGMTVSPADEAEEVIGDDGTIEYLEPVRDESEWLCGHFTGETYNDLADELEWRVEATDGATHVIGVRYDLGGVTEYFFRARPVLDNVMTPTEIEARYNLKQGTVTQAIRRGALNARKSGGTWLIRREDVEKRWGKNVLYSEQWTKQAALVDFEASPPDIGDDDCLGWAEYQLELLIEAQIESDEREPTSDERGLMLRVYKEVCKTGDKIKANRNALLARKSLLMSDNKHGENDQQIKGIDLQLREKSNG